MNIELIKSLEKETNDNLFDYFKHDGAINFEKKIIAGKILHEKGFDKSLLSQEKNIIVKSINNRLKISEDLDYLAKKNKKKNNNQLFLGIGYIVFFLILGMKDYFLKNEEIDWIYLSIMIFIGFGFIIYKLLSYKKTLNKLTKDDLDNNELLRFRLKLIENEWDF